VTGSRATSPRMQLRELPIATGVNAQRSTYHFGTCPTPRAICAAFLRCTKNCALCYSPSYWSSADWLLGTGLILTRLCLARANSGRASLQIHSAGHVQFYLSQRATSYFCSGIAFDCSCDCCLPYHRDRLGGIIQKRPAPRATYWAASSGGQDRAAHKQWTLHGPRMHPRDGQN
jgi:hypothetical protein